MNRSHWDLWCLRRVEACCSNGMYTADISTLELGYVLVGSGRTASRWLVGNDKSRGVRVRRGPLPPLTVSPTAHWQLEPLECCHWPPMRFHYVYLHTDLILCTFLIFTTDAIISSSVLSRYSNILNVSLFLYLMLIKRYVCFYFLFVVNVKAAIAINWLKILHN